MPEIQNCNGGRISTKRQKIYDSGILQALLDYVMGKHEMTPSQVSAGFALLKKILPDLASVALSDDPEDKPVCGDALGAVRPKVEFRIVDPHAPDRFESLQI